MKKIKEEEKAQEAWRHDIKQPARCMEEAARAPCQPVGNYRLW